MNAERNILFILQFVSIRAKTREKYTNGSAEGRPTDTDFPSDGCVDWTTEGPIGGLNALYRDSRGWISAVTYVAISYS